MHFKKRRQSHGDQLSDCFACRLSPHDFFNHPYDYFALNHDLDRSPIDTQWPADFYWLPS